ncbi:MAG TPA: hypothetical protein VNU26_19065 [Mycobacteriales bacterium]|nr:hypothetical protein [Mycobacteriales bacterium]
MVAGGTARNAADDRCAVHPARPALDRCPVCGRPRCAADAVRHAAAGCAACARPARPVAPPVPVLERLVRAALGALAAALAGGLVAAQYVDAGWLGVVTPAVVGAATGAAAQAASGVVRGPERGRGRTALQVRAIGAGAGVLAVGLGFLLERSRDPVSAGALLPSALAVAGALLWTAPPRRGRRTGGPARRRPGRRPRAGDPGVTARADDPGLTTRG